MQTHAPNNFSVRSALVPSERGPQPLFLAMLDVQGVTQDEDRDQKEQVAESDTLSFRAAGHGKGNRGHTVTVSDQT
jgi:hypothetical protein